MALETGLDRTADLAPDQSEDQFPSVVSPPERHLDDRADTIYEGDGDPTAQVTVNPDLLNAPPADASSEPAETAAEQPGQGSALGLLSQARPDQDVPAAGVVHQDEQRGSSGESSLLAKAAEAVSTDVPAASSQEPGPGITADPAERTSRLSGSQEIGLGHRAVAAEGSGDPQDGTPPEQAQTPADDQPPAADPDAEGAAGGRGNTGPPLEDTTLRGEGGEEGPRSRFRDPIPLEDLEDGADIGGGKVVQFSVPLEDREVARAQRDLFAAPALARDVPLRITELPPSGELIAIPANLGPRLQHAGIDTLRVTAYEGGRGAFVVHPTSLGRFIQARQEENWLASGGRAFPADAEPFTRIRFMDDMGRFTDEEGAPYSSGRHLEVRVNANQAVDNAAFLLTGGLQLGRAIATTLDFAVKEGLGRAATANGRTPVEAVELPRWVPASARLLLELHQFLKTDGPTIAARPSRR